MVIYDITDMEKPVMKLSYTNCEALRVEGLSVQSSRHHEYADQVRILPNGTLLLLLDVPHIVDIEKRTLSEVNIWENNLVVGQYSFASPRGSQVTRDDLTTGDSIDVSIQDGFPEKNARSIYAGPDGFYFWEADANGKWNGLVSIDTEGWRHQVIPQNQIKTVDYKNFPTNIWFLATNGTDTCAIYDNTQKSIRLIRPTQNK